MTPRGDLNKRAEEAHKLSVAKGFHEVEHSNEHLLCLVISELMEAVEAHRKRKRADLDMFNRATSICKNTIEYKKHKGYEIHFGLYIRDTVEDELADAVIRLLDLAGLRGVGITTDKFIKTYSGSFTENIYIIMKDFIRTRILGIKISVLIRDIEDLCLQMNIDLWQHVELKLKYNQTRPYKHGKEY